MFLSTLSARTSALMHLIYYLGKDKAPIVEVLLVMFKSFKDATKILVKLIIVELRNNVSNIGCNE